MLTFPRCLGLAFLFLMTFTASGQQPKSVTITKCQACSTKASQALQSCMASGGNAAAPGCQKTYQQRMKHCNNKWCSPKMTKVKVKI